MRQSRDMKPSQTEEGREIRPCSRYTEGLAMRKRDRARQLRYLSPR